MLSRRIIPCLDVKAGRVVKGVQFKNHRDLGTIDDHVLFYREEGADELVLYDITASCEQRLVDTAWVSRVSHVLDIPFCVAGGIRSIHQARAVLQAGADKISINSPALERPELIRELADEFGSQAVVVGIDSFNHEGELQVYQYTGSLQMTKSSGRKTQDWVEEVQALGAGEIVLNCMQADGLRQGYDLPQLCKLRPLLRVPMIASGGASRAADFLSVFNEAGVDGALAATIFHERQVLIPELKQFLKQNKVVVRA